jgi:signal-transduction protein with cAMP-binding, CBS, and nucleotidyltransferase domain
MTMTVKDIMHGATIVEPSSSIFDVARLMREKEIGSVLIKIGENEWGIATERDILIKVVAENRNIETTKVSEIMTKLQYTINSDASVQKASEIFNMHHIRRLPVIEEGEIIGIVTARDVAKRCVFEYYKKRLGYGRKSIRGLR